MDENNIVKKLYSMQNSNLSNKKQTNRCRIVTKKETGYTTKNNDEMF